MWVGTQGSTHTNTSDLEQPKHTDPLCTDINTPEEDTALDEPDTEIESWEAELAADPENKHTPSVRILRVSHTLPPQVA